jgi:hypothetical protein
MGCVTIAFPLPGWQLTQMFSTNLYQNKDYDRKKLLLRLKHHKIDTLVENLSYRDTEHKDCSVFFLNQKPCRLVFKYYCFRRSCCSEQSIVGVIPYSLHHQVQVTLEIYADASVGTVRKVVCT